jgi:hypothetical protein
MPDEPELNDVEFLEHCEYILRGNMAFRADEASRLLALAGEMELADVFAGAAGLRPYYFPTIGPLLVQSAWLKLKKT